MNLLILTKTARKRLSTETTKVINMFNNDNNNIHNKFQDNIYLLCFFLILAAIYICNYFIITIYFRTN